jgi:hypothetical protein
LNVIFELLNTFYSKNKIHRKIQDEKLCNLHRTADFTVTSFVLKIDKFLSNQNLTLRELAAPNFVFFENKNYQVKIRKKEFFVRAAFSQRRKSVAQNFFDF